VEYQVFTSVFKCNRRGIPIFINKNKIEIHFSRLFSNATEVESLHLQRQWSLRRVQNRRGK
jgi:hypothetical protein